MRGRLGATGRRALPELFRRGRPPSPEPSARGAPLCLSASPPRGGRSLCRRFRVCLHPYLHRWRKRESGAASDLPPRGGDVRQDREGRLARNSPLLELRRLPRNFESNEERLHHRLPRLAGHAPKRSGSSRRKSRSKRRWLICSPSISCISQRSRRCRPPNTLPLNPRQQLI
jgi:hypothetical protein